MACRAPKFRRRPAALENRGSSRRSTRRIARSHDGKVRLPTMLVAFNRYSQDASFTVLRHNIAFVITMAAGSVVGTLVGGLLLGVVPSALLIPILAVLLLISAIKVWRH